MQKYKIELGKGQKVQSGGHEMIIGTSESVYKIDIIIFQYKQDPSNSSIENDAAWCRFDSGEYSEHGFYITFFFSSYAIPMILIIFLYIAMLRRLWNPGSIGKQISKESLRNKKRVTRYFSHFHWFPRLSNFLFWKW